MAAKFRILVPRFWVDPYTQDLTDRQARVFIYCVTGPEAGRIESCTGIYELYRGAFSNSPFRYSLDEVDEVMDFFNRKKPKLLQYDTANHMVFIPSFFKHNGNYKKGLEPIIESFDKTFDKAPQFWNQFSQKYYPMISKGVAKSSESGKLVLNPEQVQFLDRLKELPNEINNSPSAHPHQIQTKKVSTTPQLQI